MYILRLPRNTLGRDIVVGDIHGHFDEFEQLLRLAKFDSERDRILSVGDYIDRGPDSERALQYLEQPWFYAVRGNHEAMMAAANDFEPGVYELWMRNGGEWAEQVDDELIERMVEVYRQLPYVIEVETRHGKVGVVHADLPEIKDWPSFTERLQKGQVNGKELQAMLWSRETYRQLRMAKLYPGTINPEPIAGVHCVYVGHSIVANPTLFGNMYFVDTGAYANGQLSAVDIDSEDVYTLSVLNFAIGY